MRNFRFMVAVDVDAEGLVDAYKKLLERMSGNDWESSDEAYNEGELVSENDLNDARQATLS